MLLLLQNIQYVLKKFGRSKPGTLKSLECFLSTRLAKAISQIDVKFVNIQIHAHPKYISAIEKFKIQPADAVSFVTMGEDST